jgi:Arc/MetJ-type ribon-helix-helix transcriptional regulator
MGEQETTKMVSFRLRIDQYAKLEELRSTEGVRSVSDLFRQAVEKLIQDTAVKAISKNNLSLRVGRLERKVDSLALAVKNLKRVGTS